MGQAGFAAQRFEQVDAPVPVRGLVHFLQRNDIGASLRQQPGDFAQIGVDARRGVKALIQRKAAPVRDVEGDQRQARHSGRMKEEGERMKSKRRAKRPGGAKSFPRNR